MKPSATRSVKSGLIPMTYTTGELLDILDIPKWKLEYLFDSRQLKKSDIVYKNGKRIYTQTTLEKIRKLLEGKK